MRVSAVVLSERRVPCLPPPCPLANRDPPKYALRHERHRHQEPHPGVPDKHRNWYQFSGNNRVSAPDLDEALVELLAEKRISKIEVNNRPYFQIRTPDNAGQP